MSPPHEPLYYPDYLQIEKLLSSQSPRSAELGRPAHDELLFIIVHQAYELWFKQILHELDSVRGVFAADFVAESAIGLAVARLERIGVIQKLLIDQIDVMETMTPLDFLDFRDLLFPASGFQSFQFRLIEARLGLRARRQATRESAVVTRLASHHQSMLEVAEADPSLFELLEGWLERIPFLDFEGFDFLRSYRAAVERMLGREKDAVTGNPTLSELEKTEQLVELEQTVESFAALWDEARHDELVREGQRRFSYRATFAALLINLYRDQPILHLPFRLLTALIDIDENLTAWRQRHAVMAQRMIGTKIGTGGSAGHAYLRSTAERRVFGDLANISTYLIPRSELPPLPPEIARQLGFFWAGQSAKA